MIPTVIFLDEASPPQRIHSFDEEQKYKTGWYFRDDEHDLVGPYPSKQIAEDAAKYFYGRA